MKRTYHLHRHEPRPFPILSAWALLLVTLAAAFAFAFSGCQTSPERAAHTTVKAANIAVDTAMRAYAKEVVRKEMANDATRATDPGGYLDRHRTALLLHGKVSDAKNAYRDAVNVAVTLWLTQKSDKANAPPEALATADVTAALSRLLKLVQ